MAAQRPENSSPSSPPNAASASLRAKSVSDTMSMRQPVRRAARRAFRPSLPMASESWSSGTTTVASFVSSSTSTSRTRAGERALATKRAGSGFHGMMSIFSPRSSETTMRTRDAPDLDETVGDLGHLELEQGLDQLGVAPREDHLRTLRARAHLRDDGLDPAPLLVALAVHLLGT